MVKRILAIDSFIMLCIDKCTITDGQPKDVNQIFADQVHPERIDQELLERMADDLNELYEWELYQEFKEWVIRMAGTSTALKIGSTYEAMHNLIVDMEHFTSSQDVITGDRVREYLTHIS